MSGGCLSLRMKLTLRGKDDPEWWPDSISHIYCQPTGPYRSTSLWQIFWLDQTEVFVSSHKDQFWVIEVGKESSSSQNHYKDEEPSSELCSQEQCLKSCCRFSPARGLLLLMLLLMLDSAPSSTNPYCPGNSFWPQLWLLSERELTAVIVFMWY